MEDITIIRTTANEYRDLIDILNAGAQRKLLYNDHSWDDGPYTKAEVTRYIVNAPTYIFYKDNQAVGTISIAREDLFIWGNSSAKAGYIHRLAATKNAKGLGSKILEWAEQQISNDGLKYARLDCDKSNISLCNYYLKHGYKVVKTIIPNGKNYTAALLEKQL